MESSSEDSVVTIIQKTEDNYVCTIKEESVFISNSNNRILADNGSQNDTSQVEKATTPEITCTTKVKEKDNSSKSAEVIDKILICGICSQYLQNPKWLPCLHSFCLNCLQKLVEGAKQNKKNKSENIELSLDNKPQRQTVTDFDTGKNCEILTSSPIKDESNIAESVSDLTIVQVLGGDNSDIVCRTMVAADSKRRESQTVKEDDQADVIVTNEQDDDHSPLELASPISPEITNGAEANEIQKSYFHCPTCNETCQIPPEGLNGLVNNVILSNMIEVKEKLTKTNHCEICKLREITEVAVAFCTECRDMLCKSCWQGHSFTRFTLTHKVVPLEEIEDHSLDINLRNRSEMKCHLHVDEPLKYFCSSCYCLICGECLLLTHQRHSCVSSSVAAESKKKEFQLLLYGLKNKLIGLRKTEFAEYETQCERISRAESSEIENINIFFENLIEAIEKEKQQVEETLRSKFQMMKTQCSNRYSLSQKLEKNLTSTESILNVALEQASNEEFLKYEPLFHERILHLLNKQQVKPNPVSWYDVPTVDKVNPIQITCDDQKIKLSCFEINGPRQIFNASDLIPCVATGEQLLALGKVKRTASKLHVINKEKQSEGSKLEEIRESPPENFIDFTVWPKTNVANFIPPVVNSVDSVIELAEDSPCSSSDDDLSIDEQAPIAKQKRKNGGKKEKEKLPQLENICRGMSLQYKAIKEIIGQPHDGYYGISYESVAFGNPSNVFETSNNKGQGQQATIYCSEYPSMMYSSSQPNNIISSNESSVNASEQTQASHESDSASSADRSASTAASLASVQPITIKLKHKFHFNVKLGSDHHEPFLRGVHCLHKSNTNYSIIVSDSKNGKVKTFSANGRFIKSIEAERVERAFFTNKLLIYHSKQKVFVKKEDGSELSPLNYVTSPNSCVLAWSPKCQIIVGSGNKIRQYAIDLNRNGILRTKNIGIEGGIIKQILDVRCDQHGRQLVVVDTELKSVMICDFEGQILGQYKEDSPTWDPTAACFDKRGYIFVTDGGGNRLVFLSPTGQYIQQWDTCPINRPNFVATNTTQTELYVTGHDRCVHVYDYYYL